MRAEGNNQWAFPDNRGFVSIRIRVEAGGRLFFIPDDDAYALELTAEDSLLIAEAILRQHRNSRPESQETPL